MGAKITKAEMAAYKAAFKKYDVNGDGLLDPKELEAFIIGTKIMSKEAFEAGYAGFMKKYDKTKDGKINASEFGRFLRGKEVIKKSKVDKKDKKKK